MMNLIQIEQHQGWAEIILDRPARRNALTPALAAQMTTAIEGLSKSAEVAAIVLRGADHCFCSGIDLKALQSNEDPGSEDGVWHPEPIRALHLALYRCPKPLICAWKNMRSMPVPRLFLRVIWSFREPRPFFRLVRFNKAQIFQ